MPKKISTLEREIADWEHYKKMGTWMDGKKPYKTFTHSDADEQIEKKRAQIEKIKAKEKKGGTRRRRHRRGATLKKYMV
jgi:hypothetical protein